MECYGPDQLIQSFISEFRGGEEGLKGGKGLITLSPEKRGVIREGMAYLRGAGGRGLNRKLTVFPLGLFYFHDHPLI